MSAGRNLAYELRVPFGNPSQYEESCACVEARQQLQDALRVLDDATGILIPLCALRNTLKRMDLEIIFDVNRECIHGLPCLNAWCSDKAGR
jgi:hypothetical protein